MINHDLFHARGKTTGNTSSGPLGTINPSPFQQCAPPGTRPTGNHAGKPDTATRRRTQQAQRRQIVLPGSRSRASQPHQFGDIRSVAIPEPTGQVSYI